MSVQNSTSQTGETLVREHAEASGVYASLFEKINLTPVAALGDIDTWQDSQALADATADERVTAAVQVLLQRLKKSGQQVEKLDKSLLDHHIAELDYQISRQLDEVMHHQEFQKVESQWRGLKHLIDRTDFRQNVKIEILDISKDDLRQDFEDAPEITQSGLYGHTYIAEYDTPGGEPIGAVISSYEFDASPQDIALLRNISKVAAAAHMPFTVPEPLTRIRAQITALEMEKQALLEDIAVGNHSHHERLAAIEQEEVRLIVSLDELEAQYGQELTLTTQLLESRQEIARQSETQKLQQALDGMQHSNPLIAVDVDVRTVATVIADWTGVPLSSLMKDEQNELLNLENEIGKRVVGQDAALTELAQRLRAAKTGLTSENGPQGVFLLVGPSGVGKTETALALADALYGGERSLITINLSEYQEPHTVSQLKGSPPGYVGYGQGGILTEAVRKRPYSVVLLDEVEKAHRDVMNLFYQVFDRGFMRDGEGREIDFRNTVILMTSNLGSDHLMQLLEEQPEATDADLHELIRPILRDHFQPALLARFQTVIYRPLGESAMRTIVEMKLAQVSQRLHLHYGLTTSVEDNLYDTLTAACLLPDTGARNIDSLLNQQILPVLSQQLLSHMAAKQKPQALTLSWSEEEGNAEVLRGTLALYEWTQSEMNRRRLEAIIDVQHSETERFEQGYLVRGVQIAVTLDSAGFAGRGDICLFGEMLSRFFALYTDIYLFNRLVIILQPTGERLEWEEKHNRRIPG